MATRIGRRVLRFENAQIGMDVVMGSIPLAESDCIGAVVRHLCAKRRHHGEVEGLHRAQIEDRDRNVVKKLHFAIRRCLTFKITGVARLFAQGPVPCRVGRRGLHARTGLELQAPECDEQVPLRFHWRTFE